MKRLYKLIIPAVLFLSISSCSTYKNSTTTPDDVYYSPGTPSNQSGAQSTNSDYYSTPNENYIKMRVQDPDRWSYFDDYSYDYYGGYSPYSAYSPYGFGLSMSYGSGFYSPWYGGFGYYSPLSYYNSYYAWNNFYNPYYGGVVVINGKNTTTPSYTRMSTFNPSAYQGRFYNSRPTTNTNLNYNRNSQNYNPRNNFNQSTDSRPYYNNTSPNSIGGGRSSGGFSGGGASHGGGFSRPGR